MSEKLFSGTLINTTNRLKANKFMTTGFLLLTEIFLSTAINNIRDNIVWNSKYCYLCFKSNTGKTRASNDLICWFTISLKIILQDLDTHHTLFSKALGSEINRCSV